MTLEEAIAQRTILVGLAQVIGLTWYACYGKYRGYCYSLKEQVERLASEARESEYGEYQLFYFEGFKVLI